jgi:hypothetical protein
MDSGIRPTKDDHLPAFPNANIFLWLIDSLCMQFFPLYMALDWSIHFQLYQRPYNFLDQFRDSPDQSNFFATLSNGGVEVYNRGEESCV